MAWSLLLFGAVKRRGELVDSAERVAHATERRRDHAIWHDRKLRSVRTIWHGYNNPSISKYETGCEMTQASST
jgi:hypothetical protein